MELTRWRERGREGYRVNEMEWGEAARREGKWSALQWEEAAAGPMVRLPAADFCRAWEPAWGDRTCPWPLGMQAGRRNRHGWSLAKDVALVAAMASRQCSSKGEYKQT